MILADEYLLAVTMVTLVSSGPPARGGASHVAWHGIGHRLVVRIAELRLTPPTAAAVMEILGGQDLAEASYWADRIRRYRPSTAPLHFVNIPLDAEHYSAARHCPQDRCIVAELNRDVRVLGDSAATRASRAEALRFLIHFIADLHQPLHVANNRDRGGNLRRVYFFGTARNLHQVWDGELIHAAGLSEPAYYDRLRLKMDSLDLSEMEKGTVADWMMESHRLAVAYAYQLPEDRRLGDGYLKRNLPVVDLALIRAGVRLARVLNEVLGPGQVGPTGKAGHGH